MRDHTHGHSKSTSGKAAHGFVTLHLKAGANAAHAGRDVDATKTATVNVHSTAAEGLIVAFVEDTSSPLLSHDEFHLIFDRFAATFLVLDDYFDFEHHF